MSRGRRPGRPAAHPMHWGAGENLLCGGRFPGTPVPPRTFQGLRTQHRGRFFSPSTLPARRRGFSARCPARSRTRSPGASLVVIGPSAGALHLEVGRLPVPRPDVHEGRHALLRAQGHLDLHGPADAPRAAPPGEAVIPRPGRTPAGARTPPPRGATRALPTPSAPGAAQPPATTRRTIRGASRSARASSAARQARRGSSIASRPSPSARAVTSSHQSASSGS